MDPGVSKRAHAGFNGFHKAQNGAATFVMGDVNLDLKNMAECSDVCLCVLCASSKSMFGDLRES